MNKYELMYIIDMQLEEAPRKELVDRVTSLILSNGGTIEKTDEWGKRRLAYAINDKTEGYYVLVNFEAKADLPREIERILQISDDVLRYLVIRLEEKHTSVKPRPTPIRPQFTRPPVYEPQGDVDAQAAPAEAAPAQAEAVPVEAAPAEAAPAEAAAEPVTQETAAESAE